MNNEEYKETKNKDIEEECIENNNYREFNPFKVDDFIIGKNKYGREIYQCITCESDETINKKYFRKHLKTKSHKINHLKPWEKLIYLYNCDKCNYHTDISNKFKEHELTKGHIEKLKLDIKYIYECEYCEYKTNRNGEYRDHLESDKHNIAVGNPLIEKTFKCPKENCFYIARTQQHLDNHMNTRTHNMTDEEKKQFRRNVGIKNQITGYEAEQYMNDIIISLDIIKSSRLIGYTGNIYDVKYKINDEKIFRYLQVKTIIKNFPKIGYSVDIKHKYNDDTLLVGTNHERTLFIIIFGRDIKSKHIGYNPDSKTNSYYSEYFYTDKELFINKLKEQIKFSTSLKHEIEGLTKKQQKEFCSLYRLKTKCKELKLEYKSNEDTNKEIDCFINNFRIQHKSSSYRTFNIMRRSANKERPYSDKDKIDIFLFEHTNKENRNNFYIIPMSILIEKGYIKTDKQNGCKNIALPRKEEGILKGENKWALEYLNKFELLIR
jgi:hypothetical protein